MNPIYSMEIITTNNKKYTVTNALTDLKLVENDGEIAQRVNFKLVNVNVSGKTLSSLINVRDRVYINASFMNKKDEVFRGYIWNDIDDDSDQRELEFVAYDNLIYMQKSQDYVFYESGKNTKTIASELCKNWGVKLKYSYSSITHGKLSLRGNLADIFLSDLIDGVKKKTGKKGVMRSIKDVVYIKPVGDNTQIYNLKSGSGGTTTRTRKEIEMPEVTKIVILGSEKDNKRSEVKATLEKNTKTYGTLQRIETAASDTDLSKAKSEAKATLKEKAVEKKSYTYEGIDVPFIHKGDKVNIVTNNMNGSYIVKSISHNALEKKMSMELEKA